MTRDATPTPAPPPSPPAAAVGGVPDVPAPTAADLALKLGDVLEWADNEAEYCRRTGNDPSRGADWPGTVAAVARRALAAEAQAGRYREMLWCVVRSAKRAGAREDWCGVPLWAVVRDLCGLGSTAAAALCAEMGVDPSELTDPRGITKEWVEDNYPADVAATYGLAEHPEDYDGPCFCRECFEYGD